MRGERFSESLARHAMASLPDRFLAMFLAMDEATQQQCIHKFNGYFQRSPSYHRRYAMSELNTAREDAMKT